MARLMRATIVALAGSLLTSSVAADVATRGRYASVDYYKLREGRYWMEVHENGEVLYLRLSMPSTNVIEGVRRGTLTVKEVDDLFGLLGSIGFFSMTSADPFSHGIVYEGDVLSVFACSRDRCNKVSARPPGFIPSGLADFVRALEGKIPALRSQSGEQLFLRAEEIGPAREARLRVRRRPFVSISEERLKGHPALSEAVRTPGRFVFLDSYQLEKLSDVLPDRRSSFVSTPAPFHIEVFSGQ